MDARLISLRLERLAGHGASLKNARRWLSLWGRLVGRLMLWLEARLGHRLVGSILFYEFKDFSFPIMF